MSIEVKVLDMIDEINNFKGKSDNIYLNKYKTNNEKMTFSYVDKGILSNFTLKKITDYDELGVDTFIRINKQSLPYPEEYSDNGFKPVNLNLESDNDIIKLLDGDEVMSTLALSKSGWSDSFDIRRKYIDDEWTSFLTKAEREEQMQRKLKAGLFITLGVSIVLFTLIMLFSL